jgi:polyhydroxyalkanoate synthesis regulator phasin
VERYIVSLHKIRYFKGPIQMNFPYISIIMLLKEVKKMDEQTMNKLSEIEGNMKEFGRDIKEIKEAVQKFQAKQIKDVPDSSEETNKLSDTDFQYLNMRITEIERRVFALENRAEN